jgi:hypothetical protein
VRPRTLSVHRGIGHLPRLVPLHQQLYRLPIRTQPLLMHPLHEHPLT